MATGREGQSTSRRRLRWAPFAVLLAVLGLPVAAVALGSLTAGATAGSTMSVTPTSVPAGGAVPKLAFVYTPATPETGAGAFSVTVPAGWAAPVATVSSGSCGSNSPTPSVTGTGPWTIEVSGLSLTTSPQQTCELDLTNETAPSTGGATSSFAVADNPSSSSGLVALQDSPLSVTLGSSVAESPGAVTAGGTATLDFTYTPGGAGLASGSFSVGAGTLGTSVWPEPASWSTDCPAGTIVPPSSSTSWAVQVTGITTASPCDLYLTGPVPASGATGAYAFPVTDNASGSTDSNAVGSVTVTAGTSDTSVVALASPSSGVVPSGGTASVTFSYTGSQSEFGVVVPADWGRPASLSTSCGTMTPAVSWSGPWLVTVSGIAAHATPCNVSFSAATPQAAASPETSTFPAVDGSGSSSLTALASSPMVEVQDGSTITLTSPASGLVASGGSAAALELTYQAATAETSGTFQVGLPAGWGQPTSVSTSCSSTTPQVSASSPWTVTVTNVKLSSPSLSCTLSLSSTTPATLAAPETQSFSVADNPAGGATLYPLVTAPQVTVQDGSRVTLTAPASGAVTGGAAAVALQFSYAAVAAETSGTFQVTLPAGWGQPASVTTSCSSTKATVSTSAPWTVTASNVKVSASPASCTMSFSSTPPALSAAPESQTFPVSDNPSGGTLVALADPPTVLVTDGSTITESPSDVSAGGEADLAFAYTAGVHETSGAFAVTVPADWGNPNTARLSTSCVTSSAAPATVSLAPTTATGPWTVSVSSVSLAAGAGCDLTMAGEGTPGSPGTETFQGADSPTGGASVGLPGSPSVTVHAWDHSTVTETPPAVSAGGSTDLSFTYTAGSGETAGAFSVAVPSGWGSPTSSASTSCVTSSGHSITPAVSGSGPWTVTVSGVDLTTGAGCLLALTPETTPSTAGSSTFTASDSLSGGTLVVLPSSPTVTVDTWDGSSLSVSPAAVSAGATVSLVATYQAGQAETAGSFSLTEPSGFGAPTSVSAVACSSTPPQVSASAPWTVTVTGVSLAASGSCAVVLSGVTTPSTAVGSESFTASDSVSGGTLVALPAAPSVDVVAADGSTLVSSATSPTVVGHGAHANLDFTYTPGATESSGSFAVVVPADWSDPNGLASTTCATSAHGQATVAVTPSGGTSTGPWTVTVSGVAASPSSGCDVVLAGETAPSAAPEIETFQALDATSGSTLAALVSSPRVSVADSSTLTITSPAPAAVSAGGSADLTFAYQPGTAETSGAFSVTVPGDWADPVGATTTTDCAGGSGTLTPQVTGSGPWTIAVSGISLASGSCHLSLHGWTTPPAAATPETETFLAADNPSGGQLVSLLSPPQVSVLEDGLGSASVTLSSQSASTISAGFTVPAASFTYTAGGQPVDGGSVEIGAPTGWTFSGGGSTAASASCGVSASVTVTGSAVSVDNVTTSTTCTVSGLSAAVAATATTGSVSFAVMEQATPTGSLRNVGGTLPAVTVYAPDGTQAASLSLSTMSAGTTKNATLTYTSGTGGTSGGTLVVSSPTNPSPDLTFSGSPTFSNGCGSGAHLAQTLGTSATSFTVDDLTVASAGTCRVSGLSLTTASSASGSYTLTVEEQSTPNGRLTAVTGSGSALTVVVAAADGSGTETLAVSPSILVAGSAGNTLTFTYAAPSTAAIVGGELDVYVPTGWSTPQTATPAGAGYTSATCGATPKIVAMTSPAVEDIQVQSVDVAKGGSCAITFGDATAPSAIGPNIDAFQVYEASSSNGSVVPITKDPTLYLTADSVPTLSSSTTTLSAASPTAAVVVTATAYPAVSTVDLSAVTSTFAVADNPAGSPPATALAAPSVVVPEGSTVAVSPNVVAAGSTPSALAFTYVPGVDEASGSGAFSVTLPAGWTGSPVAGPVTCDGNSVTPGVQGTGPWTVTVSGLTLPAGTPCQLDVTGVTAPAAPTTSTFAAADNTTGSMATLSTSPAIQVATGSTVSVSPAIVQPLSGQPTELAFTYTAGTAESGQGSFSVTLPASWSDPTATSLVNCGSPAPAAPAVTGTGPWVITVSGLTLDTGATCELDVTGETLRALSFTGPSLTTLATPADTVQAAFTVAGAIPAADAGSYSLLAKATNAAGSGSRNLTVEVSQPAVFATSGTCPGLTGTTGQSASFVAAPQGSPTSFPICVQSGYPTPSISVDPTSAQQLPVGLTLTDNGNGTATIGGAPAAGTGGVYNLTLDADNGTTTTEPFTLTVDQAPAFAADSPTNGQVQAGVPQSYTLDVTGYPAPTVTVAEQSSSQALPAGITVDNSGAQPVLKVDIQSQTSGYQFLTLTATTTTGSGATLTATSPFTLQVIAPPSLTTSSVDFENGQTTTYTLGTTGGAVCAIQLNSGAPSWLQFTDNGNGTGSLTTTTSALTAGTYDVTFHLYTSCAGGQNANGVDTPFTVYVDDPPTLNPPAGDPLVIGTSGIETVQYSGTGAVVAATFGPSNATSPPSWLSYSATGGQVTFGLGPGAPLGTYQVLLTVTDSNGATAPVPVNPQGQPLQTSETVTLHIDEALNFTATGGSGNPMPASVTLAPGGSAQTYTVTATGYPSPTLTLTQSNGSPVPTWATLQPMASSAIDTTSATLTVSPPSYAIPGAYPLVLTASGGPVGSPQSTQTLPLDVTVAQTPKITSANAATFQAGVAQTVTITESGYPLDPIQVTGAPSWLTVNAGNSATSGTATLTGTPPASAAGTTTLQVCLQNGTTCDDSQSLVITVDAPVVIIIPPSGGSSPPTFTSPPQATFPVGKATTFQIQATGYPVPTLTESGALPQGVTFSAGAGGTATLSGTPAAAATGTYPITFNATNGTTSATQSFTLLVDQDIAITSAPKATFTVGTAGTFTIRSTGAPLPTVAESGALPKGVSFTANTDGTALLAGTPAAGTGGAYTLTLTSSDGGTVPDVTQAFTLTVDQAPAVTSAATTTFVAGTAGTFPFTATGYPLPVIAASGALPAGVSFAAGTAGSAALSGTPASGQGGSYRVTVTAANGVGADAKQTFTLVVSEAPIITADPSTTTAAEGGTATFTAGASGGPVPTVIWQVSTDGGRSWRNVAGPSRPTLVVRDVTVIQQGDDYRAVFTNTHGSATTRPAMLNVSAGGYRLVGANGRVYAFGNTGGGRRAVLGPRHRRARLSAADAVVGMASTPDGQGYWVTTASGVLTSAGDAAAYPSLAQLGVRTVSIVGMAALPTKNGLWLVTTTGQVYAFGAALSHGSLPTLHVRVRNVVGITATPDGGGYWIVTASGAIFRFGDARSYGSPAARHLRLSDVVGLTRTADGRGYWIATRRGQVLAFGDARPLGSVRAGIADAVAIMATPNGGGYWVVTADGAVFRFGDAQGYGSLPAHHLKVTDIRAVAAT